MGGGGGGEYRVKLPKGGGGTNLHSQVNWKGERCHVHTVNVFFLTLHFLHHF